MLDIVNIKLKKAIQAVGINQSFKAYVEFAYELLQDIVEGVPCADIVVERHGLRSQQSLLKELMSSVSHKLPIDPVSGANVEGRRDLTDLDKFVIYVPLRKAIHALKSSLQSKTFPPEAAQLQEIYDGIQAAVAPDKNQVSVCFVKSAADEYFQQKVQENAEKYLKFNTSVLKSVNGLYPFYKLTLEEVLITEIQVLLGAHGGIVTDHHRLMAQKILTHAEWQTQKGDKNDENLLAQILANHDAHNKWEYDWLKPQLACCTSLIFFALIPYGFVGFLALTPLLLFNPRLSLPKIAQTIRPIHFLHGIPDIEPKPHDDLDGSAWLFKRFEQSQKAAFMITMLSIGFYDYFKDDSDLKTLASNDASLTLAERFEALNDVGSGVFIFMIPASIAMGFLFSVCYYAINRYHAERPTPSTRLA